MVDPLAAPGSIIVMLSRLPGAYSSSGCPPAPTLVNTLPNLGSCEKLATSQGLTLVHFSAQPEPFLSQNTP